MSKEDIKSVVSAGSAESMLMGINDMTVFYIKIASAKIFMIYPQYNLVFESHV